MNGFGTDSRRPSDMNFINSGGVIEEEIIINGNNNSRRPSPSNLKVPNGDSVAAVQAKKFLNTENRQCFV